MVDGSVVRMFYLEARYPRLVVGIGRRPQEHVSIRKRTYPEAGAWVPPGARKRAESQRIEREPKSLGSESRSKIGDRVRREDPFEVVGGPR